MLRVDMERNDTIFFTFNKASAYDIESYQCTTIRTLLRIYMAHPCGLQSHHVKHIVLQKVETLNHTYYASDKQTFIEMHSYEMITVNLSAFITGLLFVGAIIEKPFMPFCDAMEHSLGCPGLIPIEYKDVPLLSPFGISFRPKRPINQNMVQFFCVARELKIGNPYT